jgi:flagellar motor component MotA
MSSTNSIKSLLRILGWILILFFIVLGLIQSGNLAYYVDPYGFLFILVSGVALVMISFPGAEIGHALRHAVRTPANDAEIGASIHFWEAAGRGFWILGVSRSILNVTIGFAALATQETGSLQLTMRFRAQSLVAMFYGVLLAVICFIPCWKLMGKLQSRTLVPETEQGSISISRPGWRFGATIGYVLFFSVLASFLTSALFKLPSPGGLWMAYQPGMLLVLGGAIALMLFMGGSNSGSTLSTAFAGMGLITSLMGCIQMLFGMTDSGPQGIAAVAGSLAFILSSCLTALLGMVLVGAPLEDRAIRTGQVAALSVFSRVSWYVFPLLGLMFTVLVFDIIIVPLRPQ